MRTVSYLLIIALIFSSATLAQQSHPVSEIGTTSSQRNSNLDLGPYSLFANTIGIGTTSPDEKFVVKDDGNLYVKFLRSTNDGLYFYADGDYYGINAYDYTNLMYRPLTIGWGGQNVYIARTGGNVGVGKTNPSTKLDVAGAVTATSFSGSGSGLTGTAPSLTAGTANSLNPSNSYSISGLNLNSNRITNVQTPISSSDAATRQYVDDSVAGAGGGAYPVVRTSSWVVALDSNYLDLISISGTSGICRYIRFNAYQGQNIMIRVVVDGVTRYVKSYQGTHVLNGVPSFTSESVGADVQNELFLSGPEGRTDIEFANSFSVSIRHLNGGSGTAVSAAALCQTAQ